MLFLKFDWAIVWPSQIKTSIELKAANINKIEVPILRIELSP